MKKRAAWRACARVTASVGLCLLLGGGAGSQDALRAAAPLAQDGPECVLRAFLRALTKEDLKGAHALVAPSTKEEGDPIAYRAKADYDSFAAEAAGQPAEKFGAYRLGKRREEAKGRVRIFVHFDGGDNDETLLVREDGRWYVADPIHIIR